METTSQGLAGIDYVIVLMYMAGVLIVGTWFSRYIKGSGDFFMAGKSLPFWAIGMSIVVSDIGAIDFVSAAGSAYKYGLAQANFDWLGSVPAVLIAAFIFIPYYWRTGVYTIPEFLGRRYNTAVRMIISVAWGLVLLSFLSIMLLTTAKMFEEVLGWSRNTSVWVTVGVVGVYALSGGLAAVVMTDVIQMVIMFVGGGALVIRVFYEVGGWDEMSEKILALGPEYANHLTLYLPHDAPTPYPWTGIVFGLGIVLSTAYFIGNQAVVQRALGARTEWDAKAGVLFAGLLKLLIPVLVVFPGLAAVVLVPGLEDPDKAMPILINQLLPTGLRGLMIAAFLAALMSSIDSYLNSSSTLWVQDVFRVVAGWFGTQMSDHASLVSGRVLGGFILVSAGLLVPVMDKFETIYTAIQSIMALVQGPTLAIALLGIFWRRTNQWGGLTGLVVGILFCAMMMYHPSLQSDPEKGIPGIFPSDDPFLFVAWWSFVLSLFVTVVVSLLTPADPEEKLRGMIFGDVLADSEFQSVLKERTGGE